MNRLETRWSIVLGLVCMAVSTPSAHRLLFGYRAPVGKRMSHDDGRHEVIACAPALD